MLDQLNSLKKVLGQKIDNQVTNNSDSSKNDNSIVFKLFTDLENADLNTVKKLAHLNSRLENLEKVFGPGNAAINESQIANLCNGIENKTILVNRFYF